MKNSKSKNRNRERESRDPTVILWLLQEVVPPRDTDPRCVCGSDVEVCRETNGKN